MWLCLSGSPCVVPSGTGVGERQRVCRRFLFVRLVQLGISSSRCGYCAALSYVNRFSRLHEVVLPLRLVLLWDWSEGLRLHDHRYGFRVGRNLQRYRRVRFFFSPRRRRLGRCLCFPFGWCRLLIRRSTQTNPKALSATEALFERYTEPLRQTQSHFASRTVACIVANATLNCRNSHLSLHMSLTQPRSHFATRLVGCNVANATFSCGMSVS
jgi:hypothetical protein